MAFKTKLDFSSNRQVKQHEKTITALSGGTSFGLTYSALTYGPDLTTSSITQTYTSIASTFSGNSGTTNYTWYDSRMYLGESELSAITPSNSASTQDVGIIFVANNSTTIDGNFVALNYSGVSYDLSVIAMYDLGGGSYSGTVLTNVLDILSAGTLDYTGRTIWADVSGITRTERLIITNNPQIGYVWTCIDSEGLGEWQYNGSTSGSTIWTAGTGVNSAVLGGSGGYANDYSVSEGFASQASGWTSHAEGYSTQAIGPQSHAEGDQSISSGTTSHAEGTATLASGQSSHSEGNATIASGVNSHAQGYLTIAGGSSAHAEGYLTIAGGDVSHAGGYNSSVYSNFGFIHSNSSIITSNSNNSAILGGSGNTISAHTSSFIGGGENNLIDAAYYDLANRTESIIGGEYNTIRSSQTSGIYAGSGNTIAYAPHSIIAGGYGNIIGFSGITTDPYAYALTSGIFAGHNNKIINNNTYLSSTFFQSNVILGGTDNIIDVSNTSVRYNAIIGGADGNIGSSVMYSTLLGGSANAIDSGVNYSSIVAGTDNLITSADKAFIGGGAGNQIIGNSLSSAIIGGSNNVINNIPRSVILGGDSITATTVDTVYVPQLNIQTIGDTTKATNLAIDVNGNVISSTTGDIFYVNKSPEAIPFVAASPTSKGIPEGQVITGFTTTKYNNTTTTTPPFGSFNNATGVFTATTTCILLIQAWIHLKTDTSSSNYWSTTSTGQVGMGITVDNTTDFYCGDYQVALQNITNHIDISTSTIVYATAGTTFKLKVLNQTDRNYAGSGSISGDQARMSFTRLD